MRLVKLNLVHTPTAVPQERRWTPLAKWPFLRVKCSVLRELTASSDCLCPLLLHVRKTTALTLLKAAFDPSLPGDKTHDECSGPGALKSVYPLVSVRTIIRVGKKIQLGLVRSVALRCFLPRGGCRRKVLACTQKVVSQGKDATVNQRTEHLHQKGISGRHAI